MRETATVQMPRWLMIAATLTLGVLMMAELPTCRRIVSTAVERAR